MRPPWTMEERWKCRSRDEKEKKKRKKRITYAMEEVDDGVGSIDESSPVDQVAPAHRR